MADSVYVEGEKMRKFFPSEIKQVDDDDRAILAVITAAVVDRDGDVIIPDGVDATEFEKNPVVMFNHDYYRAPIGKCSSLERKGPKLIAKTVFARRPETLPSNEEWFPDTLLSLYKQGVMNAFSIGFTPKKGGIREATDADIEKWGPGCRRVISKLTLWEYSACAIPANPAAVQLAIKSGAMSKQLVDALGWSITEDRLERGAEADTKVDAVNSVDIEQKSTVEEPKRRCVIHVLPSRSGRAINPTELAEKTVKFVAARKRGYIFIP